MENHHFQKTANRLNQSYSITIFNSQLKLPKLPEDYHQWRAKGSTQRNRRCFEVCDMWVALAQAHERLGGSCRGCLGSMAPKKDREARTHHTWIVLSYLKLMYFKLLPPFFWGVTIPYTHRFSELVLTFWCLSLCGRSHTLSSGCGSQSAVGDSVRRLGMCDISVWYWVPSGNLT